MAEPASPPSTTTWVVVGVAAAVAVVVFGVLLTLPAWRERGGARLAVAVLALQTGAVVVGAIVLVGLAIRTWQLIDRPEDDPGVALVRISGIDGDTAFFALMVLLVAVGAALLVTITALCARFAAGTDPLERTVACALLALELGVAAYLVVRFATGDQAWPSLVGTIAFPVLAAAFATCWPSRTAPA